MAVPTRFWLVAVVVVVVVGVVPWWLDRDSYPLSTYPMFSTRRTSAEVVDTAVAGRGGQVWRLDRERLAATDEVVLVAATVSDAIRSGETAVLCAEIGGRVAERGPADADWVEVVTERFEAWSSAPPATFPMSPQVHWQKRIQEVTVKDVIVRALHDGKQVAVLVEYADPTQDPDDAAALEFHGG